MTTAITKVVTWLSGQWVGQDSFGNHYYVARKASKNGGKLKRWVVYAKQKQGDDASFVAPNWHRWLHHGTDKFPKNNDSVYSWQKAPSGNPTGSAVASYPKGIPQKNNSDIYQAWKPLQFVEKKPHKKAPVKEQVERSEKNESV